MEERQDVLREVSRWFAEGPDPTRLRLPKDLIARVKASYAYVYDCNPDRIPGLRCVKSSRFPFDAERIFRELCDIKARYMVDPKPISSALYEDVVFRPHKVL
ncbi:hypothetical protein DFP72DRAFT_879193 [Ephemerocybe angulata]|uniref:Uncharacterized protein n=1 Tax=Ephemerocybe angulata TaxID=980116 RepID=A0A8H6IC21_9AGAR|nr:hypothetical protein DFP72DRAFT_879193 [Tulosesus angulatus]